MRNAGLISLLFVIIISCSEDSVQPKQNQHILKDSVNTDTLDESGIQFEVISDSHLTDSSATIITYILSDGGREITQKGLCWDTVPNPTVFGNRTFEGRGSDSFTTIIYNLEPRTRYYGRSYAINANGLKYSEQFEFVSGIPASDTITPDESLTVFIDVFTTNFPFALDLKGVPYTKVYSPYKRFIYQVSGITGIELNAYEFSIFYDSLNSGSFYIDTPNYTSFPIYIEMKIIYDSGLIINAGMNRGTITVEEREKYYIISFDGRSRNFLGGSPLDEISFRDGFLYLHK